MLLLIGISNELVATDAYVRFIKSSGHDVVVAFIVQSPDGVVFDPTFIDQPYGFFLEIKCPYSVGEKHRKMLAHQVDLLVPRRNAIKKLYYVFIGITYTTHKYGNRRKAVA